MSAEQEREKQNKQQLKYSNQILKTTLKNYIIAVSKDIITSYTISYGFANNDL